MPKITKLSAITKEELHRLYHVELLSQWQIAARYEVTQGAVMWRMKRWGIPSRTKDEGLLLLGKQLRFTGPKNPRWTGGKHIGKSGYVFVRDPKHPKACNRGYVREHVMVWMAAGRELPPRWHIHHKNGIKHDNRLKNLEAMPWKKHRDLIPELNKRIAELEIENEKLRNTINGLRKV